MEHDGGAEKLGEVLAWRDSKLFSPLERAALEYAERITTTGQKVDDTLFAELKKHFTEAQIVELTVRTALCGFFNRVNDALGIGIEEGVIQEMLAKGGRREDLDAHPAESR